MNPEYISLPNSKYRSKVSIEKTPYFDGSKETQKADDNVQIKYSMTMQQPRPADYRGMDLGLASGVD